MVGEVELEIEASVGFSRSMGEGARLGLLKDGAMVNWPLVAVDRFELFGISTSLQRRVGTAHQRDSPGDNDKRWWETPR